MIRLYRVNTGSCGGCDREIAAAVIADTNTLTWVESPQDADVLLLTGPITPGSKAALLRLLRDVGDMPLLAIGRCAIDGHPFGKGGVQETAEVTARAHLEGCPPSPETITDIIRHHAL
jgi:Ni,Fe-hydrogenase III small subunit